MNGNHAVVNWNRFGIKIIGFILCILVVSTGCLGIRNLHKSGAAKTTVVAAGPDKCSRCHEAWSHAFDYYRGWDRYGGIFTGEEITGAYDPWFFP